MNIRLSITASLAALFTFAFATSAWAAVSIPKEVNDLFASAKTEKACNDAKRMARDACAIKYISPAELDECKVLVSVAWKACKGRFNDPCATLHCDDGNPCNGVETCNPASGCVAGTPINCGHGICNPTNGRCTCAAGWTGSNCNVPNRPRDGGVPPPPPPGPDAGEFADAGEDPCADLREALANTQNERNQLNQALVNVTNERDQLKASSATSKGCSPFCWILDFLILLIVSMHLGFAFVKSRKK